MSDNKDTYPETYQPTEQELAARNKRNAAIGIGLAVFMIFVFLTMLSRVGVI